jgi:hypothetical protein
MGDAVILYVDEDGISKANGSPRYRQAIDLGRTQAAERAIRIGGSQAAAADGGTAGVCSTVARAQVGGGAAPAAEPPSVSR